LEFKSATPLREHCLNEDGICVVRGHPGGFPKSARAIPKSNELQFTEMSGCPNNRETNLQFFCS
jgi:hypothetical protein